MCLRQSVVSRPSNKYIFSLICALIFLYIWAMGSRSTTATILPDPSEAPEFPKLIWYKLGPKGLNEDTRSWTSSCIASNPEYHVEFITDEAADEYVQKTFATSRPDIVDSYLNVSVPIVKADMLRYLLLWDQGGIWFDLDVSCEADIPIANWIPSQYRTTAGLVVGWEFDVGWKGPFVHQFASWTIIAKPRSPHMLQIIEGILRTLHEKAEAHHVPLQNITLPMMGEIVDLSGPRRMTFGIYESLEKTLSKTVRLEDIQGIVQPTMVGDVLVMPGRSFAAASNRYEPEEEDMLPPQLVTHHYAGSWKNSKGGESK